MDSNSGLLFTKIAFGSELSLMCFMKIILFMEKNYNHFPFTQKHKEGIWFSTLPLCIRKKAKSWSSISRAVDKDIGRFLKMVQVRPMTEIRITRSILKHVIHPTIHHQ
jgi:hypothetical protein